MARSKNPPKTNEISEQFQQIVGNEVVVDEDYIMKKDHHLGGGRQDSEDSTNSSIGFELITAKDTYQADKRMI